MGAIFLALGIAAGIVGLAWNQAGDPSIKRFFELRRLLALARNPNYDLSLADTEDALVLARRLGERELTSRFERLARSRGKKSTGRSP